MTRGRPLHSQWEIQVFGIMHPRTMSCVCGEHITKCHKTLAPTHGIRCSKVPNPEVAGIRWNVHLVRKSR